MTKRRYYKPAIETHLIDKDISLIMMSYGDEDNPPPDPFGAAPAPPNQPASKQQQPNPFENNPFEGK